VSTSWRMGPSPYDTCSMISASSSG
jgi:hypothetical protein